MERLPLEIITLIASYIPSPLKRDQRLPGRWRLARPRYPPLLAPYATISQAWQRVVESRLFASIWLCDRDLDQFADIFRDPRRQRLLGDVRISIVLPARSKECLHSGVAWRRQKAEDDCHYSAALRKLFGLLHSWEHADRAVGRSLARPINLDIALGVQSQAVFDTPSNYTIYPSWGNFHRHDRNVFLALLPNDALPTVQRVSRYTQAGFGARMSDLEAFGRIVAAFNHLEVLEITNETTDKDTAAYRRDQRHGLCSILESHSLSKLTRFSLSVHGDEPRDHSRLVPDVRDGAFLPEDRFSLTLHQLSRSPAMTSFKLSGRLSISPELFWPRTEPAKSTEEPYWPTMQYLYVSTAFWTPDGQYYMTGEPSDPEPVDDSLLAPFLVLPPPPYNGDSPDGAEDAFDSDTHALQYAGIGIWNVRIHEWRHEPHPPTFDPLIRAIVRAARHMPNLKQLRFEMGAWEHQIYCEFMDSGERSINMAAWDILHDEDKYYDKRVWVFGKNSPREFEWQVPGDVVRNCREIVGEDGYVLRAHEHDGDMQSLEEL